jgi:hypothetical protein
MIPQHIKNFIEQIVSAPNEMAMLTMASQPDALTPALQAEVYREIGIAFTDSQNLTYVDQQGDFARLMQLKARIEILSKSYGWLYNLLGTQATPEVPESLSEFDLFDLNGDGSRIPVHPGGSNGV